ncbi:hypothetical protein T484DRAFT_1968723 [Baffinella frigidus]|nr:hypothetical protein T484DRAFT_1968723 [Cryptophyta sp. CCMP2293]
MASGLTASSMACALPTSAPTPTSDACDAARLVTANDATPTPRSVNGSSGDRVRGASLAMPTSAPTPTPPSPSGGVTFCDRSAPTPASEACGAARSVLAGEATSTPPCAAGTRGVAFCDRRDDACDASPASLTWGRVSAGDGRVVFPHVREEPRKRRATAMPPTAASPTVPPPPPHVREDPRKRGTARSVLATATPSRETGATADAGTAVLAGATGREDPRTRGTARSVLASATPSQTRSPLDSFGPSSHMRGGPREGAAPSPP